MGREASDRDEGGREDGAWEGEGLEASARSVTAPRSPPCLGDDKVEAVAGAGELVAAGESTVCRLTVARSVPGLELAGLRLPSDSAVRLDVGVEDVALCRDEVEGKES